MGIEKEKEQEKRKWGAERKKERKLSSRIFFLLTFWKQTFEHRMKSYTGVRSD